MKRSLNPVLTLPDLNGEVRSYFETTDYFYYVNTDLQGNYLYVNPLFKRKFHYISPDFIGQSILNTTFHKDLYKCQAAIEKLLADPQGRELVDLRKPSPDGGTFWTRWELSLLLDEKGEPYGVQGVGVDITEEENRFRIVSDTAPVMIWMSDERNNTIYVNKPWIEFTGINVEHLDDHGWRNVVHLDDTETGVEKFNAAFERREPITMIYRLRDRNGGYRWVLDKAIPRILRDGSFLGYTGSVVDIHEQKLQEDRLRYGATVLENVSDTIITCDTNSIVRSWNKKAEEFFGIREQDALGKTVTDLVRVHYLTGTREEAHQELAEKGSWRGEVAFDNQAGERNYLLNTLSYLINEHGERIGTLAVGKNITARRLAEQKLKESESFYRTLINHSIDGILLTDDQGNIEFSSKSLERILGYKEEELMGRSTFEFVHPDDFQLAMEAFAREVIQSPEVKHILVRVKTSAGEWLWCMIRGHNLIENTPIGKIAIYVYDDTLRKRAEDALKESEERFRNLIRDLQLGVVLHDSDARMILCNKASLDLLGVSEEQLLGKSSFDPSWNVIQESGSNFPGREHPARIAIETRRPVRDVAMGIFRPGTRDRVWLLVNAEPIMDDRGQVIHVISSYTDITLRKRLEKRVIEQEISKQKYITQITIDAQERERQEIGKELHDNFGQQLTTLKLYLDLVGTPDSARNEEFLRQSQKMVGGLINEIRMLSRSLMPPTLGDLGLVESVKELTESISRVQTFRIHFCHQGFDESGMPENKKLMIFRIVQEQLNNIIKYAAATEVTISMKSENEKLLMRIADNGKGFDPEITKKGVGFNSITNRVGLFNGEVEIFSMPGQGCSVNVVI